MIGHDERIDAVEREAAAFAAAVIDGDRTTRVPTCPDWSVADLAIHVGQFCGFWTHVLCDGTGRDKVPHHDVSPDDPALGDWLQEWAGHLVAELRATPPETEVWTWFKPDRSAGFVARRCANELAIHRYDAQTARDAARPIEPNLAVDGIEEMVVALVTARRGGEAHRDGRTIHVHGTDEGVEGAEWLLTLHPDRVEVARVHAKGDLALRGSVSDLELLLYGRPTLGAVERFGDESLLDAWRRTFTF